MPPLPLVGHWPRLAEIPRVALGAFPSPVEEAAPLAPSLWLKRDDLAAEPLGGNKVRALEFLLAGAAPGSRLVTVGAHGSTHALAVATYARLLGLRAEIFRWPQEMSDVAELVARRTDDAADVAPRSGLLVSAFGRALAARARGARWIPAGGCSPLGILGHVNAGLELAGQIARGELPAPRHVVVPLGTGGTMAGLAIGLGAAGVDTTVVGVRVVPRIVARLGRVRALMRETTALIERVTGAPVRAQPARVRIHHEQYGGAYGRATTAAIDAVRRAATQRVALDVTYAAKAFAAALAIANGDESSGPTLFWLTFDGRWLGVRNPPAAHRRAASPSIHERSRARR